MAYGDIGFVLYPEVLGVDLAFGGHGVPCRLQKSMSGLALGGSLGLRHCGDGRKEVEWAANGFAEFRPAEVQTDVSSGSQMRYTG
jgi:hypothetical protein